MTIRTVCVLGGTGFIGGHVVAQLYAKGYHVTVLTRRTLRHRALKVLPTARLVEADVHDLAQLKRHFAGQDAVINLVGILNERGHDGSGFRRAHTELAQKVVEACKAAKVRRLLHMSALNADSGRGTSHYLRTKGEAENHVHTFAAPVAATIFRPSVVFGPGDSFVTRFARLLRRTPGIFPLTCPDARFQPVYVADVAAAFVAALEDKGSYGQRYDLCGPKTYTLREIVEYVARVQGLKRRVVGLPDGLSRLIAGLSEHTVKFFSVDNYKSLQTDSVCPADCRPCPTALEAVVPAYLGQAGREAVYQRIRRQAGR